MTKMTLLITEENNKYGYGYGCSFYEWPECSEWKTGHGLGSGDAQDDYPLFGDYDDEYEEWENTSGEADDGVGYDRSGYENVYGNGKGCRRGNGARDFFGWTREMDYVNC